MSLGPIRRIVTGHDAGGNAIIQEDGPPARIQRIGGALGPLFYEVWNTRETPARIDRASGEPPEAGISLAPPTNGTRIRVLDIAPDDTSLKTMTPEQARAHFAEVGATEASSHAGAESRHAFMHRTETVDYGIVLEGEITAVLEGTETVLRAGDICVQRGTNHAWHNRTDAVARVAFILLSGQFQPELRDALGPVDLLP
jgi:mannose-6-phosphate isomerase-like protein (cupin superfamily)